MAIYPLVNHAIRLWSRQVSFINRNMHGKLSEKIAIFFLILAIIITIQVSPTEAAKEDSPRLVVNAVPPVVPADSSSYMVVIIQLLDSQNKPLKAQEDIEIFLSSSDLTIGSVDTRVRIQAGNSYTIGRFQSTDIPGSVNVTAIASGYKPGSTIVKTALYGKPMKLTVYTTAPRVLADNTVYKVIVVQLQDQKGNPAYALQNIALYLSSSDTTVGTVESEAIIPPGQTYIVVSFHSTFRPGSTMLSVIASGYQTGTALMQVEGSGLQDFKLTVKAPPTPLKVNEASRLTVEVTSLNGFSEPVQLNASGLRGVAPSFTKNPVTPPGTSELTITPTESGERILTVSGKSGALVHSEKIVIDIVEMNILSLLTANLFYVAAVGGAGGGGFVFLRRRGLIRFTLPIPFLRGKGGREEKE